MKLISDLKDKLYYFFVEKNPEVKKAYQGYVNSNADKHHASRWSSWRYLIKCNLYYRLFHLNQPLFTKTNQVQGNEDALSISLIFALEEMQGSLFRFFQDQGFANISVYGKGSLLSYIWSAAYHSGYPVSQYISDKAGICEVMLPEIHSIPLCSLRNINDNPDEPILVLHDDITSLEWKGLNHARKHIFFLNEVLWHVYENTIITEGLREIRQQYPWLPIVICNLPSLHRIKNRSTIESYIMENVLPGDYRFQETWHQNVLDQVFRAHGFDDEYIAECTRGIGTYQAANGIHYHVDYSGKYVNSQNGCRITTGVPPSPKGTLYMFGNSTIQGMGTSDDSTIASCLQSLLNQEASLSGGPDYGVLNCANIGGRHYRIIMDRVKSCSFRPGDIAFIGIHSFPANFSIAYQDYITCDTQPLFDRPHNMGEIFYENAHMNFVGYQTIANCIFNTLKDNHLLKNVSSQQNQPAQKAPALHTSPVLSDSKTVFGFDVEENRALAQFVDGLQQYRKREGIIGAVVMNCNPFTNGHRYLIEAALKQVDHLFVFVVEEDKSVFPFADRLRLVQEGTADLKGLTVLPSGRFMVSSLTFDMYFYKETLQNREIDPSADVMLFGQHIAPALDISIRFVGEEPYDTVTAQYNYTMEKILPGLGVMVKIIPRAESDGKAISASYVRKLLAEKDWYNIKKLVPETTYSYLINIGSKESPPFL